MSKVYVLISEIEYESLTIEGVYSTREHAAAALISLVDLKTHGDMDLVIWLHSEWIKDTTQEVKVGYEYVQIEERTIDVNEWEQNKLN